jgi:DNA-binding LacI/PurR family transcriptional regulator
MKLGAPTAPHGVESTIQLMAQSKDDVTAIVAGSSHVTLGVLSAVKDLGIDVPRRLSIVGFGDPPWFKWWGPGLTTVHLPIHELATTCGLWLLRSLNNKETRLPPLQSMAHADLIVRGSTAMRSAP